MDFKNTKPSKNFVDKTDERTRILSEIMSNWAPWEDGSFAWDKNELHRLNKGENVLDILRERMKNNFLMNWLTEGPYRPARNFDAQREEQFDTHSNLRKRSQGSAYDNY